MRNGCIFPAELSGDAERWVLATPCQSEGLAEAPAGAATRSIMVRHGNGDDRRRWTRVVLNGGALGRNYSWGTAPILDISEGGALLEAPCVLRPRSWYTLQLVLEGGPTVDLRAGVVRSYVHGLEPVAWGETRVRYRAGVQFSGMTGEERALLRERLSCGADAGA